MADRSVAGIVRRFAAETPGNTAIKFGSRRVTWRELDERSTRAAAGLRAVGISSQQRVAFLAKNCLEYFEVSFGAAKLNAVVVAINWRLTPAEIVKLHGHCHSKCWLNVTLCLAAACQVRRRPVSARW